MSTALELNTKVYRDIVGPSLNESSIRRKASELGYSDSITEEQAGVLFNAIVGEVKDKIQEFYESSQAKEIDSHIDLYDYQATYTEAIKSSTKKKIYEIYHTNVAPSVSSSNLWQYFANFVPNIFKS